MDTKWTPTLAAEGPRYRALADEIAAAVEAGALRAGERLPPVRELAWSIGVTPGTVARAYQLAENRGYLEGQVGRGTFVRRRDTPSAAHCSPLALEPPAADSVDFRMNRAVDVGQEPIIQAAMERLVTRVGGLKTLNYHSYGADLEERAAAAEWLAQGGVPAKTEEMVLCYGAQHALLTALAATMGGRDAVALTEPLIHPGLKDCARALGVRLEAVETDGEGLIPDALDAACARHRPSAVLLTANDQNPTLTNMSSKRREEVAEVVKRRRTPIIEDDVYGWLKPNRAPSFPSLVPGLTWYIAGMSKCVAAGLRLGFLLCPPGEGARAGRILRSYTGGVAWMISALGAEMIRSGDAARIVDLVRDETRARVAMVRAELSKASDRIITTDSSTMAWAHLPEPWRASDFVTAGAAAKVLMSPAEVFAVGRAPAPHAVRLSFGAVPNRAQLWAGLAAVARLMKTEPTPVDAVA